MLRKTAEKIKRLEQMKNYNSLIVQDFCNKKSFLSAEKWINQHKIVQCDDERWESHGLSLK